MRIEDASVLITGAAQRVGAVLVRTFAAAGARVIIHCNQSVAEANALLEEIGGENAGHSVLCCDLSKPENIPAMFNDIPRDVSILINNASIFNRQGILHENLPTAKAQFDLNFWTPVELMRTFYQHSTPSELAVVNLGVAGTDDEHSAVLMDKGEGLGDAGGLAPHGLGGQLHGGAGYVKLLDAVLIAPLAQVSAAFLDGHITSPLSWPGPWPGSGRPG